MSSVLESEESDDEYGMGAAADSALEGLLALGGGGGSLLFKSNLQTRQNVIC